MTKLLFLTFLFLGVIRAEAQSRVQIERLATLGKIWGFLKYYHSGVATGPVRWDSVLLVAVPRARDARTSAEYRAVVQSLLDVAGPVLACPYSGDGHAGNAARCRTVSPDSMRINLDLRWLQDTTILGERIARQLARVRENPHRGSGHYVSFRTTAKFDADTALQTPEYPPEGQRLLALFRFWNASRYYFPYMYVNGGDWNVVLPEFIPPHGRGEGCSRVPLGNRRVDDTPAGRARIGGIIDAQ